MGGCRDVVESLAGARKHDFAPERAVFLTGLHRLFAGGSDRAADRWREDYRIEGVEGLDLHHLYRAMALARPANADHRLKPGPPSRPLVVKTFRPPPLIHNRFPALHRLNPRSRVCL